MCAMSQLRTGQHVALREKVLPHRNAGSNSPPSLPALSLRPPFPRPGLLSFGTVDIWGQTILHREDSPSHCRMFSGIPGL